MCIQHTQPLDLRSWKGFTLGDPPRPPVTPLRLDQQRQVIGHSPFSTDLPSVFAEGKWLREGFPHRHEDLRQLVLWEAIE